MFNDLIYEGSSEIDINEIIKAKALRYKFKYEQ